MPRCGPIPIQKLHMNLFRRIDTRRRVGLGNLCSIPTSPTLHMFRDGVQAPLSVLNKHIQPSRPHSTFLVCLSSLASVFLLPHFLFVSANFSSFSFAIIGDVQHKLTKNCEHSNFSANDTRVHVLGSSARSRRISSISTWPRWYFFSYGLRIGCSFCTGVLVDGDEVASAEGGVGAEAVAKEWTLLRGSVWGRNFCGV